MNVVFFTNPPVVPITGGAERSVVTVADWLETRGHRCFLLSVFPLKKETDDPRCVALPNGGGARSRENRRFFEMFLTEKKIGAVLWWPGGSRKFPFVDVCNALGVRAISCNRGQPDYYRRAALSKARGFDSLVVRNPLKRAFLALKLAWKDRKYRRIFAFNTKFSDAYQLLSEHYFPDFRAYFPDGNVPCPLVAVGNMCAFPREEIDIAAKKKELVFVGRLKFADKRPDYLLRIWSRLEKRFPEWTLRLVGSGADEAKLRALAGTLGLTRVFFEGFRKPQPYYRGAAIFCMTSAYEGFPNVVIEAASFGCVPVAFDSFASIFDIVEDGENGALVPAFDLDAYAETLARLMRDDALRERLARAALAQIPAKFSPEKIGAQWERLLEGNQRKGRRHMKPNSAKRETIGDFRVLYQDSEVGRAARDVFLAYIGTGISAESGGGIKMLKKNELKGNVVKASAGGFDFVLKQIKPGKHATSKMLKSLVCGGNAFRLFRKMNFAFSCGFRQAAEIFLAAERCVAGCVVMEYVVMEYVQGVSVTRENAAEYGRDVAKIIRDLHRFGIIHGDVHPYNFIVEARTGILKSIDISGKLSTPMARGYDLYSVASRFSQPFPERHLGMRLWMLREKIRTNLRRFRNKILRREEGSGT